MQNVSSLFLCPIYNLGPGEDLGYFTDHKWWGNRYIFVIPNKSTSVYFKSVYC